MRQFLAVLALIQPCFAEINLPNLFFEQTVPDHKIEIMIQKPLHQHGQAIVFLHGAQDRGLSSISPDTTNYWVEKGYAVAAISMPGFGESSGTRDFCGPFTLASLNCAINRIKQELEVSEFGLIGFGQGALAATLLSAERTDIKCVVCSNGGYDLLRHQGPDDSLFAVLRRKYDLDCDDEEALIARSPLYRISDITAPTFMVHRKGNPVVSEKEAIDFHEAMILAGKQCHLAVKDRMAGCDEQKLSFQEILIETESWFDSLMKGE